MPLARFWGSQDTSKSPRTSPWGAGIAALALLPLLITGLAAQLLLTAWLPSLSGIDLDQLMVSSALAAVVLAAVGSVIMLLLLIGRSSSRTSASDRESRRSFSQPTACLNAWLFCTR
ncbi:MAG: hypothetical protein HC837_17645 [Chloroflexaceae bacterium]|nr:hypothetical protein [Chloroflexaceae bacterium]